MTSLSKLFSPITIGSMEIKNRLVMAPMTTDYGTNDQFPSERLIRYLEERARGGVGLITVEVCSIDRTHRYVQHSLSLGDEVDIPAHQAMVARLHDLGAKVQPQITHPGPESLAAFFENKPAVGPSPVVSPVWGGVCRELSIEEIEEVVKQYGHAARRAQESGYDGMELHAVHSYNLLGSFLSPYRNKRTDEYAGNKVEGRTKMLLAVIREMKEATDHKLPLTLRISGYERVPGGRDSADTAQIAPMLVEAGVDAFHVSGGVSDRLVSQVVVSSETADGFNVPGAEAIKQVVDVPVMVAGRIHDPRFAEKIIKNGQVDMVVMGRPLLADPQLPNKAKQGRFNDIRYCLSCENCIDSMQWDTLNCAVNPFMGREHEIDLERTDDPKQVLVIGGGPGGMEAARVALLKGHRVILMEKSGYLGGSLTLASTVHDDNEKFLDYLLDQIQKLPIDIRLGQEITLQTVKQINPDVVIVAVGGTVSAPTIPGDDLEHVFTGPQIRRMLAGTPNESDAGKLPLWQSTGLKWFGPVSQRFITPERVRLASRLWMPIGSRVAIVGADLAGIELAEFLAKRKRRVFVVDKGKKIAPEIGHKRRFEHMERLDKLGVVINIGVTCDEIVSDGLWISTGTVRKKLPADTIILAGSVLPNMTLYDQIKEAGYEAHAVGDCRELGLIVKATYGAAHAVNNI
ncbi:MAG: FAD-dependent oxidoreductase [Deltaproteobacteria bacterium]|nr:FAD-dependent oxidoreductase [Deltaproteobacteria bacterium]